MNAGMASSFFQSPVIRSAACPGAKTTGWCRFLATRAVRQQKQTITFRSAAEMLDVFGLQQGGPQCRRLITSFQRVFGATIFLGMTRNIGGPW
jgi:hypothetical protein